VIQLSLTPSYFQIGPLNIYWYGLCLALSLAVYSWYLKKRIQGFGFKATLTEEILLVAFISALIGARLYHILSQLPYYLLHPQAIFFVWQGGLGIFGAIVGAAAGIILYCRSQEIKPLKLLNFMAPPLLLAQAIGRWGNFFNREGFGPPTNLPWKVFIPLKNRPPQFINESFFHPTFFYESFLCLAAFGLYLWLEKKLKSQSFGLAYFLIAYGTIRFITEFFRLDTWKIASLKIGYPLSLIMIAFGCGLIITNKINLDSEDNKA